MQTRRLILLVFIVAAIAVTIQRGVYDFPNDFAIYRASFWNLVAGRDLYMLRLDQAHDYFKYSPTFALLFAPFAVLPFVAGLLLWNAVNAVAIVLTLRLLFADERAAVAQALVFLPTIRSMQSSQSNALVAALMILAFVSYERDWLWRGALAVALGAVIKIFPVAALSFALPRRDRARAIAIAVLCIILLVALPLLVIPPHAFAAQYKSWGALEQRESALVGASAMALIRNLGLDWPAWPAQLVATVVLLAVLVVHLGDWSNRDVRLQFLGLTLLFCVVFNHRAERQAAVIAVCGMVIWYLSSPRAVWKMILFAIAYAMVTLSGSELVPAAIKGVLSPEVRFTIPLTIVWLVAVGEFAFTRNDRHLPAETR